MLFTLLKMRKTNTFLRMKKKKTTMDEYGEIKCRFATFGLWKIFDDLPYGGHIQLINESETILKLGLKFTHN